MRWRFASLPPATGELSRALTWRAWHTAALDVATACVAAGGARGASLAILAGNRLLWPLAELGGALAGMVTVGIYPTSAPSQVRALLQDAGVSLLVVDTAEQLAKVREATSGWSEPLLVIADVADARLVPCRGAVREVSWTAFAAGRHVPAGGAGAGGAGCARGVAIGVDDIAMLIYTSGSTGEPKGARISQRCVIESARSVRDTLALTDEDSSLSFLPYCHAGERLFGLYTRILCGMSATLVGDPLEIWEAQVAAAPTLFGGMPRFFEKVYEALLAARSDAASDVATRWDRAIVAGRERSRLRQDGIARSGPAEAAWRLDLSVIRPTLDRHFGARLRLATSGGATLPLEVAEYLDACGVPVLGAYGQTEHLCAAFNRPGHYRHDSVGVAMPGTTIRIGDDGEVQLQRSALTFSGYHRRPEESRAAFTPDGEWLRTGDLGTLDADGFLRITGRIKELIALSNGKKVAPLPLEGRLCAGDFIAHAVVTARGIRIWSPCSRCAGRWWNAGSARAGSSPRETTSCSTPRCVPCWTRRSRAPTPRCRVRSRCASTPSSRTTSRWKPTRSRPRTRCGGRW
ncbi:MAG: AMP-binding protein [Gemmatimonadetes bacterium]|nr:AMP-binding protein [Gemmatimonadota bacterium]